MDQNAVAEHRAVGARVRQARRAAGMSLRASASRLGISPASLSAVENGKTGLSVARLPAFADTFDTTVGWLLADLTDDRHPRRSTVARAQSSNEPADAWRIFPPLHIDPVLAAAIDAFVATGYHGATMRSIARRANMSVPGVYHHCRDKQDLLMRALELTMNELHWRVPAARHAVDSGTERVARVVEALALFHTHRHQLAFIGASEMRSLTAPNRRRIVDLRNEIQYLLDADIDAAATETNLPTEQSRLAGRAIATMCTSLPQWFRLDGPAAPEQIATDYADFALGLLGLRRSQSDTPIASRVTAPGK